MMSDQSDHDNVDALFARAQELHQAGKLREAEIIYEQVLALDENHVNTLTCLGTAHLQQGHQEEGIRLIGKSLEIYPDQPHAHNNLGNAFRDLNRLDEALASYDRALALRPDYPEAYYNGGNTLQNLNRLDEALASYDRALVLRPDYPEAYYNRGNTLLKQNRPDEALASYDRTLALKPDYAETYSNRGNALMDLKRPAEALASFDQAIALNSGFAEAYYNRGGALQIMNRPEQAFANYERALASKIDFPYLLGLWLHCKMLCCHWEGLEAAYARITSAVDLSEKASPPFTILAIPSTLALQQRCAQTVIRDKYPGSSTPLWRGERHAHDRIRIGYFSTDFRDHPTAHLMAELFERHDRSRFQITGFSFGPPINDTWRQRLEKAFDRFFDVRTRTDREIVALAREKEIDIAIDLNGHTEDARTGIFALRSAPVQVSYLGYMGTMGADYIDYLLADSTVVPEAHKQYYNEKIVYLPHSYQVNNSTKAISDRRFSRAELGLPDDSFVFCCFNNSFKITPDLFDIWMRLLRTVPGSVLWLFEGNASAARNLRLEAETRGVSADRLVFAPRMELADYLARYRSADLFLDTFYYNAGATASDALWAGLPVLTCLGQTFSGRMAASLLTVLGLPELITCSHAEYETLARELATQPERLAALRRKLAENRSTHPLFDTARFTRHIEEAYSKMFERYQAGLPPDHIVVKA